MDLNEDGHGDILSGSYSRKSTDMAGLFQVLYGQPGGGFAKATVLKGGDGEPLIIPIADKEKDMAKNICTRPTAVDWDGDGDLDLVVGNLEGTFYVFAGKGKGRFDPAPDRLETDGGEPLKIPGGHGDPAVVDWDGDGDLDILSGSGGGGVYWSENLDGGSMAPFTTLLWGNPSTANGVNLKREDLIGPIRATRVWVADVDGNGKLDLLVGDSVTLFSAPDGVDEEAQRKARAELTGKIRAASQTFENLHPDTEEARAAYEELGRLYNERERFMNRKMTGFVWFYRQV